MVVVVITVMAPAAEIAFDLHGHEQTRGNPGRTEPGRAGHRRSFEAASRIRSRLLVLDSLLQIKPR